LEDDEMKNAALYTAGTIFGMVSLVHLVRYFRADEILIGGYSIPVPWSLILGLVILGLAGWMVAAARQ
jgi:hypothetical protein